MENQKSNQFEFDEKEGIIRLIFRGDQTYETIHALWPKIEATAKRLRDSGRPVLVLGDTTEMGYQDSGSRKAGVEIIQSIGITKYALVIRSRFLRVVSEFIARATGFAGKVMNFSNPEDALSWLKAK